jgi:hypothetical protein
VLTLPSYPHGAAGNAGRRVRHTEAMLISLLRRLRLRSTYLYSTSLGSICLCIVLWIRAKTIGEDERGNAERRALFVGLWPPMFWLIGETLRRLEAREERAPRRLLRARGR